MTLIPGDYVRKMATERQIKKVWPIQAQLSDFLIWKFREQIIEGLVSLRRDRIDVFARDARRKKWLIHDNYPIGECLWIRDCVFNILKATPREMCPELPHISPFAMPLRKIWVIQHDKYMQNAIQAGSWIIDAANDTCDRYKYPVSIQRIEHSGMRNLRNHEDLCGVLEKYWWVQCYPNIYYPILAPFFPVIFSFEGKVGFWASSTRRLDASGIFDGFISAEDFIFNSEFSDKRLTPEQQEQLVDIPWKTPIESFTKGQTSLKKVRNMFSRARLYGTNHISAVYLSFMLDIQRSGMELGGGL